MLDLQFIRENPDLVSKAAQQKGYKVDVGKLITLDEQRRKMLAELETLRQKRNQIAAAKVKPTAEQVAEGRELKTQIAGLELQLEPISTELLALQKAIPNVPYKDVLVGKSEDDNQVAKTVGQPPRFDFKPKNHWEIGEAKGWIDKERAAKVSGSRFAYIKGDLVKLQWAILQFALNALTDEAVLSQLIADNNLNLSTKPFVPVLPPLLIKTEIYDAMDRLEPREERYKIEGEELWLQGSAEHVLGSMHANELFNEADLPLRYVGFATSFRKEAGTYGKDMEGIIRMHQFDKLEMEALSTAETSFDEHLLMIALQEYLMGKLGLAFRVINKCTADIGKPNARGWDIDVWLPGQNKYRETHTADYMTDYQTRRLQTRVRRNSGQVELMHTNDATVMSMRPLIAIIENYQTADGDVIVPEALRPYMNGKEKI
jgi:seryl-tRNA synthetase